MSQGRSRRPWTPDQTMHQDPRTRTNRQSQPLWERILPPPGRGGDDSASRPPARREPAPSEEDFSQQGLYIISVASRILEMHPQTLRKYERIGLVRPSRTMGMLRLYSEQDIAQLRTIKHLVDHVGLNLAGVELVLDMMRRLATVQQQLAPFQDVPRRALEEELESILNLLGPR